MRQLVYAMFLSDNCALCHLWWNENLVKHQRVSKHYENDCRSCFIFSSSDDCFWWICIFLTVPLMPIFYLLHPRFPMEQDVFSLLCELLACVAFFCAVIMFFWIKWTLFISSSSFNPLMHNVWILTDAL